MVWEIPYTFIAGTKAKANEVNSNFTSIKQFVDQLESNQATNELNISNLESNKADVNGSQTEIFQVANAANNFDAVNLQSLKDYTANTLDVIRGFIPSKSNSNTISCTAGDCWDSTYTEMISSSTSLSLQDTALSADTTYYIYVCYNTDTSTCQLAFSTNSTTPALPVGFTLFRKIGSFTTDNDSNIIFVAPISQQIDGINNQYDGYIKFPTGLIYMWGYTGSITPRGNKVVSLPLTVNRLVGVQLTLYDWVGRSSGDKNSTPPWADTFTNNSFVAHNYHEYETWNLFWFAIAY